MFIAFLNSLISQFASFFIFFIICCAIFAFEANVLIKSKIIKQKDQKSKQASHNDGEVNGDRKKHTVDLIYSIYCVISGSLYLLVLIQVPYLEFNVTNGSFFTKYQTIRIIFSIFISLYAACVSLL